MALTPDQRALLQLLLERGQSYGDIAALLDTDEGDVRARARQALAELAGADPDRNVGLSDWLLGQADPIGRADAVRHLRQDADDHRLAEGLLGQLAQIAPAAELPRLPGEPRGGFLRRPSAPTAPSPSPGPAPPETSPEPRSGGLRARLEPRQSRLLAILALAGVILLVVVLAVAGAFSGGGEESASAGGNGGTTTASDDPCAGDLRPIARVPLQPVDNGDAAGLATVGIGDQRVPCIDLQIRNLEQPPNGQTYIAWFLFTPTKGYPLAPLQPQDLSQDGSYSRPFQIPSAVISLVARARYIEIALAPDQTVAQAISRASKDQTLVIDVPGQAIARGTVPAASGTSAAG